LGFQAVKTGSGKRNRRLTPGKKKGEQSATATKGVEKDKRGRGKLDIVKKAAFGGRHRRKPPTSQGLILYEMPKAPDRANEGKIVTGQSRGFDNYVHRRTPVRIGGKRSKETLLRPRRKSFFEPKSV